MKETHFTLRYHDFYISGGVLNTKWQPAGRITWRLQVASFQQYFLSRPH